ncbi:MAG: DUF3879 family protein [Lachnospiraceae bacterium]|nr:DUF3879 family protein [Lachnospiraceae bacterium]
MTDGILRQCLANSIYGSFMVLAVLVIRRLFQGRVPHKYVCALWLLVLLRLIMPVSLEADFGVLPETSEILALFEGPIGIHSAFQAVTHNTSDAGNIPKSEGFAEISEVSDKNNPKVLADSTQDIIPTRHATHGSVLSVLWLFGSGLLLLYMALGMLLTGRRLRFAVPELYRILVSPFDDVQRDVKVYLDENVEVPFLYGLLKPRIYLPCGLPMEEAVHVIRHELAHIRRCDQVWKPLYFIVLSFYWYERMYNSYFAETVKESDPDWEAGEDFDPAVLASITREEIEQYISSDGVEFTLQKD